MKTLALMAFLAAGVVGTAIVVMKLASTFIVVEHPHPTANLSAPPLWTSVPVRIERASQRLERLPPDDSTYAQASPSPLPAAVNKDVAGPGAGGKIITLSAQHVARCANRYRSFNPETNTYRSFHGALRSCADPDETVQSNTTTASVQSGITGWCSSRYKSYRSTDNTYQPLAGGPRRPCMMPRYVADASAIQ
ncbi:BA14K family protein [Neorhizobium sp. P12A]|nr:BA14K family protein [Neorhizobium sp. P12A]